VRETNCLTDSRKSNTSERHAHPRCVVILAANSRLRAHEKAGDIRGMHPFGFTRQHPKRSSVQTFRRLFMAVHGTMSRMRLKWKFFAESLRKVRVHARPRSFPLAELVQGDLRTLEVPFVLVTRNDSVGPAHARIHASLRAGSSATHCTRMRKKSC